VTCVGCNAVYCGMLEGAESQPPLRHALPAEFAGYVPYLRRSSEELFAPAQASYLCQTSPLPGMSLSWTISGSYVYFKQALSTSVAHTWHGIGITDVAPYDMGYADFIVSIFAGNYTGIRDLYKYDAGNHYPCWDVLTQCSLHGQAGTMDLIDRAVERSNGVSTSTWTRLLDTGDSKDKAIKNSLQKVMFAHGVDDQFTYHPIDKRITCDMNFFSGTVRCGGPAVGEAHISI